MKKELLQPNKLLFDRKAVTRLVLPIMAEQVLAALIGMADTLMVSSRGEAVLSGVVLVDSISLLVIAVFTALSTGGTIVVSQYIGRREPEQAKKAANQVFMVTLVISLLIGVGCALGRSQVLRLVFRDVEDAVLKNGSKYFLYIGLSYPFLAQFNTCSAIFRANRNSFLPMIISIMMNVMNIGGNAIFIFGLGMGADGAGLASLISRIVGCGVLFVLARSKRIEVNLSTLFPLKPDGKMIKKVLRVGIPTGLENGIFQIGKLLVQGFVTSYGTMHIAANGVASNLSSMAIMVCASYGLALITVVGQCMGAGESEQARSNIIKFTGKAWAVVAVLNLAMIFLSRQITRWYGFDGETAELTRMLIIICCAESIVLWPCSFIIPYGLRAAGDVRFSMVAAIASMWIFRVGLGYYLGSTVGLESAGILYGMGADWLFRAIVFTMRFASGKWKQKKVI